MRTRSLLRWSVLLATLAVLAALLPSASVAAAPKGGASRFLVTARSKADYGALRAKALHAGAKIVREMPQVDTLVVKASASVRSSLAADSRTADVATDGIRKVAQADRPTPNLSAPGLRSAQRVTVRGTRVATAQAGINPDPALSVPGLLWDYGRIGLPQGWNTTAGSAAVTVGVADTGLDYTHVELAPKVKQVVDFTGLEDPPICPTFFGLPTDEQLAAQFGGPATTDWNGHGSWIGGNIAAALNGTGTNGIAPKVGLVALKISQNCGSAYDSELLAAFLYAADHGIDIVSISFGGYTDRSDPDQEAIYQQYIQVVRYARSKGTVIAASAGNEHLRIGAGGKVLSHGPLTDPAASRDFQDYFGLYETPGGVPGVVDVSATGNLVNPSSGACAPGTKGSPQNLNATCKPITDRHQAAGVGRRNQLAYYSNFGPRIDLAAPGGARKFNLPFWDRGGTPGFPYTSADLTNVWEDFSITSNWATQIPCFVFAAGSGFPAGQCYTAIQGTSMATPHVSAALALIASAHPALRHHPAALVTRLEATANTNVNNFTQKLSATDTTGGDLTRGHCTSGYCHLGGGRVSNSDAYGAGLVNVAHP
jgi:subtilisin family serine protease